MAMPWKNIVGSVILVGATTLVTTQVVSQDVPPDLANMPKEAQQAMERMQAFMKYGEPGPEHEHMAKAEGTWHNATTQWLWPGAPPSTSEGVAKLRPILGGRYMLEELTGIAEFMGQTEIMEGLGIFGYDRYREKHFFVWLDSFSTMPMWGEGEQAANGDIVYYSTIPDPSNGKSIEFKSVQHELSGDKSLFTMYEKTADGSWFKHLEITATRR